MILAQKENNANIQLNQDIEMNIEKDLNENSNLTQLNQKKNIKGEDLPKKTLFKAIKNQINKRIGNPEIKENEMNLNHKNMVFAVNQKENKENKPNNKPINVNLDQKTNTNPISMFFPPKKQSNIQFNDYYKLENDYVLRNYGSDIFHRIKSQEKHTIFPDMLIKHRISREIRTKMVDWMIEVFNVFEYSDQIFFTSVHILDSYFALTSKVLEDKDIHLLGMICMWIATKFEDSNPFQLKFLIEKVGHNTFSKEEIILKEVEVINDISPDTLITTSAFECICSFFQDFFQNNKEFVDTYKITGLIKHFEINAIYYSKVMLHFSNFNDYPACFKGVACILVAFDQIRTKVQKLLPEEEYYLKEWIKFIMKENKYEMFSYEKIYMELCAAVESYNNLDYISFNLNNNYSRKLEKLKTYGNTNKIFWN